LKNWKNKESRLEGGFMRTKIVVLAIALGLLFALPLHAAFRETVIDDLTTDPFGGSGGWTKVGAGSEDISWDQNKHWSGFGNSIKFDNTDADTYVQRAVPDVSNIGDHFTIWTKFTTSDANDIFQISILDESCNTIYGLQFYKYGDGMGLKAFNGTKGYQHKFSWDIMNMDLAFTFYRKTDTEYQIYESTFVNEEPILLCTVERGSNGDAKFLRADTKSSNLDGVAYIGPIYHNPEPSTMLMFSLGIIGIGKRYLKRRKK
jgi:hypothetical protein